MLRLCVVICCLACIGCGGASRSSASMDLAAMTPDERAAYEQRLADEEQKRRAAASEVPGLTVGQVEDMPAAPDLPDFLGMEHEQHDLELQALLNARAEAPLLPASIDETARATYLVYIWQPAFDLRQRRQETLQADRQVLNQRFQEKVSQQTAWREEREARRRAHEQRALRQQLQLDNNE